MRCFWLANQAPRPTETIQPDRIRNMVSQLSSEEKMHLVVSCCLVHMGSQLIPVLNCRNSEIDYGCHSPTSKKWLQFFRFLVPGEAMVFESSPMPVNTKKSIKDVSDTEKNVETVRLSKHLKAECKDKHNTVCIM